MTSATTPAPVEAKASVWEDFLDIFYEPSQVFARRMDGKFGLALLALVIISAVLTYASMQAMEPVYMAEVDRQMAAQSAEMTPEQMSAARSFGGVMMLVFAVVGLPIMVMLAGLTLWLVGKLFDSVQTLGQGLMVATYAQFPRVLLGLLLMTIQGFLMDLSTADRIYDVTFSAARFAGDGTSELMLVILSRFDVFIIWTTVLLGIGLHVTGKIPKSKAMIAAFIVWALGALPAVLGALRAS
jgi:hypothetical protein